MKVYIAGKITGDPDYRAKFNAAQRKLETMGHIVLNPAILPEGMEPADYMRICLAMIDTADVVVLLYDWIRSVGARVERDVCYYARKKVYTFHEFTIEEEPT